MTSRRTIEERDGTDGICDERYGRDERDEREPNRTTARHRKRASPAASAGPRATWGGWRPGAGRKPKGEFALVAHGLRPKVPKGAAVLITLEFKPGLPAMDRGGAAQVLATALRESDGRCGLALLAHALYPDHLHLIVRARSRLALSRGMNGLGVRTARALNGFLERRGTVFADRYEARPLANEREVRAARRSPCEWRRAPESAGRYRPTTCTRTGARGASTKTKTRVASRSFTSRRPRLELLRLE